MINKIEFFCDGCNLWSHRWCVSVSKLESKCLTEKSAQTWYRKTVKVWNVSMKINSKIDNSFVSKSCQTPIHKKCLGLRLSEIHDNKNSKTETHWGCQTCMGDRFLFTLVENKKIVQNTFNSSFFWKCQTSCKYEKSRPEFVFKYRIIDNDHDRSYDDIIDDSDAILDYFVFHPNFKY